MESKDPISELLDSLRRVAPDFEQLRGDAESRLRAAIEKVLKDMGVLTKAEFDTQQQALARAEQRIAELEAALQELQAERDKE